MFSIRSEGGWKEEGKGQHMSSPRVQREKEIIQKNVVDPNLLKNRREMFRNLKWLMVEVVKQMTHLPSTPSRMVSGQLHYQCRGHLNFKEIVLSMRNLVIHLMYFYKTQIWKKNQFLLLLNILWWISISLIIKCRLFLTLRINFLGLPWKIPIFGGLHL